MTADALAGDCLIAIVLLRPGWEGLYHGHPPIHEVACLGKILADRQHEDGRYNLMLRGLCRVRLNREICNDRLYRSARVQVLPEQPLGGSDQEGTLRKELIRRVRPWFTGRGLTSNQFTTIFGPELPLGAVTDLMAYALPLTSAFKQELLEELDEVQRTRRLLERLEAEDLLSGDSPGPPSFPPEFSSN
jgi:Lon protease-like protein